MGGPRQRTVLALLGLNADRVTLLESLVEAVWGERPPPTARSQIQICVSALRKVLPRSGAAAIVTHAAGYLLSTQALDLDTSRFTGRLAHARGLAGEGRTAEAAAELRAALALWRGPALADVDSDAVRPWAAQLEERRLAAIEERVHLDLALGRHDDVIGELYGLVDREPLRERLHACLMTGLYRAGRQAEALDAYRRARTILVEELGIEPGPELQKLEHAILNRDPRLDLPSDNSAGRSAPNAAAAEKGARPATVSANTLPRQLPAAIADFVGRSGHVEQIVRHITAGREDPAGTYATPIVAISGKAGVGKSTLAVRVTHETRDHFPDGQLYASLQGAPGTDPVGHVLGQFLRAVGVDGRAIPDAREERARLYRSRLADKRVLVVLDDAGGTEAVRALLPGGPGCTVIVTSRARLTGLPGALRVELEVFDHDQSLELLTSIVGRERVEREPAAADQLTRFCAGLPLALRIAGARLASRPHWCVGRLVRRLRDEAARLDELAHDGMELRPALALTYRSLGREPRRLFRLLAAMEARDFAGWTAAALLDTSLTRAEDVLEELVDVRLVDAVTGGRQPRYRFHDLVRVYARELLAEHEPAHLRSAALRRVLGAWLALAEEAHRREYGGDFTVLHGNAPRWRLPEAAAGDLIDHPSGWWESERAALSAAVRQAADNAMDELCWDLALTSVTLYEARGYFADWAETAELALAAARNAGNNRGTAATLYSLGTLHIFQKRLAEAAACFAAAYETFQREQDRHGCGLVLRNMAFLDRLRDDDAGMLTKYTAALDALRTVGDRAGEAHILCNVAKIRLDEGDGQRAREILEEALAISRDISCLRVEAQILYRLGELHLSAGEVALAHQAFNWVLRIVRDRGDLIGESYALYGLGVAYQREGRRRHAEGALLQALELAEQVGERLVRGQVLSALGEAALADGAYEAALAHLGAAERTFADLGSTVCQAKAVALAADAHAAAGDPGRAGGGMERATRLLAGLNSAEAIRLRTELARRWSRVPRDQAV